MLVYMLLMLFAMGITILLTPTVRRLALTFNVLTPLRERDVHVVPTPRMGGVALTGGFALALLLGNLIPYLKPVFAQPVIWAVLFGAVAMCLLGAIDDIWELDWMAKLGGQLIITGVMAMNGVQLISFPVFGLTIGSSRLSILVSILLMVTIINAVNFIDGLDGLAAGVIAIGAGSFFLYSYLLTRLIDAPSYATSAAVIMVALVGACLGFLWYNFHPASIFMGDSGSMVLGLLMGAAGIIVTGQINPYALAEGDALMSVLPLLLPMVVIAIPLVDLVMTAAWRLIQGKSPFTADRTHLHDRLLNYGHSHRGVVLILYAWTLLLSGVGVSLIVAEPLHVIIAGVVGLLAVIGVTAFVFPGMSQQGAAAHVKGSGVPGGPILVDDGIEVISRAQVKWRKRVSEVAGGEPTEKDESQ